MFDLAQNTKMRGIGYKALNVLRPCNIIALLMIAVASWVMIVMTGVTGQFFFFDAVAHVFISSISIFLILTEVQFGPLKRYFERAWPVFAERHGFLWLGGAMVVLGCDMLANLNKPAFSIDNLGLPLWRVILAAGILSLTFGFSNFAATIIFRDGPSGLTARMIRNDGNLADGGKFGPLDGKNSSNYYASSSLSSRNAGIARYNSTKEEMLFGGNGGNGNMGDVESAVEQTAPPGGIGARLKRVTQVFKKSPLAAHGGDNGIDLNGKKIHISRPIPVGGYDDENAGHGGGDYYNMHAHDAATAVGSDDDDERSAPSAYHEDRSSPIIPDIRRPPTAMHPALSSSHYSVANMDRF